MEVGREEGDLGRRDGKFPLFGSGRGANHTDDVSTAEDLVDGVELFLVLGVLQLCHDLNFLAVTAKIIEN